MILRLTNNSLGIKLFYRCCQGSIINITTKQHLNSLSFLLTKQLQDTMNQIWEWICSNSSTGTHSLKKRAVSCYVTLFIKMGWQYFLKEFLFFSFIRLSNVLEFVFSENDELVGIGEVDNRVSKYFICLINSILI